MIARITLGRDRLVMWGLLLGIFFLGMVLRLHDLDADSLWMDEMDTVIWAQLDLPSLVATIAARNDPPLVYLVTRSFMFVLGDSEFVVRLPAMLLGSLSILLAYEVGEMFWTSREGLLGALLLAVNAYHVRYSQEARHYALMVFLAMLSLIFLVKALRKSQKRLWVGFVLSASLSIYNHAFAFLFLFAEVLFAGWVILGNWLQLRKAGSRVLEDKLSYRLSGAARQALMFTVSVALVGVSYLPWVPIFWGQASRKLDNPLVVSTDNLQLTVDLLREVIRAYSGDNVAAVPLYVGLFLLGLVTCDRKLAALVLLWVGIPFAFLASVEFTHSVVHPRYLLFGLPLYVLVAARGMVVLGRCPVRPLTGARSDRKWPRVLVLSLMAVTLAAVAAVSLRDYYAGGKPDWRSAAGYLEANMQPGDLVLADGERYGSFADNSRVTHDLSFYLTREGISETQILPVKRKLVRNLVRRLEKGEGELWAVVFHSEKLGNLHEQTQVVRVDFDSISVIRLRETSGDMLQDSSWMLQALLDLLPAGEAHYDVHLALADIYLRIGDFHQAALELDMADEAQPSSLEASRDLAEARAEYAQLSGPVQDMQNPLWRSLGRIISFIGYNVRPGNVRAGEHLEISLCWQALDDMSSDYSVFIHVVGPDGRIWAQRDELLRHDHHPTSTWEVGEIVKEEYELELASDTLPGEYLVKTGIYYWDTGERLPVWDEAGSRLPDDIIILEPLTVNE